jgi:hypothetical protein
MDNGEWRMIKVTTIKNKRVDFAIRIVKVYRHLIDTKKEFVLSKQ